MSLRHLVLLPGSLCDEGMWEAQIAALADIAIWSVADYDGCETIEAMADRVLSQAPATFSVAGFSIGGFVALEIVRRAPDRVTHLALLDTIPGPDAPETQARRRDNIAAFAQTPQVVLDAFVEMTRGAATPLDVTEAVRASMYRHGPKDYVAHQLAMMNRPDACEGLIEIRCPTLILCGGDDRATPPAISREMAAAIPGSTYVEIAGAGHMTTLEAADEVNQAMREWLRGP